MKVLLINIPVQFNSWQNLEMPLGISYIASELENHGHEVRLKDYEVEYFQEEELKALLLQFNPELVGLSFRSSSYVTAKRICMIVREMKHKAHIVLGGHHVTAFLEDTMEDMQADFAVRGEGEYPMVELIEALNSKRDLSNVSSLTFRKDGKIISNLRSPGIRELDNLSFPAWHLLPMDKYVQGSVLTSRGCPFSCIYCDKGISTRLVQYRSPENLYKEIVDFEKKYKKGRTYFVDDYLFLYKKRLVQIFDLMIQDKDLNIKWTCQARVEGVDADILARAKQSGCHQIIYGIESGDEEELEYMHKQSKPEDTERAIHLTREAGILSRANFMIGFPITRHVNVHNSLHFAKKIRAGIYRFFIVSPLPNTVIWDRMEELHPELRSISWDKYDFYTPSWDTLEIKKEELKAYVLASYLYVLKRNVLRELTLQFIPRFIKLLSLAIKKRRIRGNLSVTFPACVNLFLEEYFIFRNIPRSLRLHYFIEMLKKVRQIERSEKEPLPSSDNLVELKQKKAAYDLKDVTEKMAETKRETFRQLSRV